LAGISPKKSQAEMLGIFYYKKKAIKKKNFSAKIFLGIKNFSMIFPYWFY